MSFSANTLWGYFHQTAKSHRIEMDIRVQLPEAIALPETELSVVLGNLLKNAVEAASGVPEAQRKITVRGKTDQNAIFFEIVNPYCGTLRQDKSGDYLSSKARSRGVGLSSVRNIVKAHKGLLEITAEGGVFRVSVLLD